jgi:amino acid transporter
MILGTVASTDWAEILTGNVIASFSNTFFWLFAVTRISFSTSIATLAMKNQKQNPATRWTLYAEKPGWLVGLQFLIAITVPFIAFSPMDDAVYLVDEVKNVRTKEPLFYRFFLPLQKSFFSEPSLYLI